MKGSRILIQDSSCHWYLIASNEREKFVRWDDAITDDDDSYTGPEFHQNRISGPHSIIILEWEEV